MEGLPPDSHSVFPLKTMKINSWYPKYSTAPQHCLVYWFIVVLFQNLFLKSKRLKGTPQSLLIFYYSNIKNVINFDFFYNILEDSKLFIHLLPKILSVGILRSVFLPWHGNCWRNCQSKIRELFTIRKSHVHVGFRLVPTLR